MSIDHNFNNLYILYITSKQSYIVILNKPMIEINKKLKEIYINLQRLYYLLFLLEKFYATLLINTKIQKFWVMYL